MPIAVNNRYYLYPNMNSEPHHANHGVMGVSIIACCDAHGEYNIYNWHSPDQERYYQDIRGETSVLREGQFRDFLQFFGLESAYESSRRLITEGQSPIDTFEIINLIRNALEKRGSQIVTDMSSSRVVNERLSRSCSCPHCLEVVGTLEVRRCTSITRFGCRYGSSVNVFQGLDAARVLGDKLSGVLTALNTYNSCEIITRMAPMHFTKLSISRMVSADTERS